MKRSEYKGENHSTNEMVVMHLVILRKIHRKIYSVCDVYSQLAPLPNSNLHAEFIHSQTELVLVSISVCQWPFTAD